MTVSEALRGVTRLGVDTSALVDLVYSRSRASLAWNTILKRGIPLVGSSILVVELLATQEAVSVDAEKIESALARLEILDIGLEVARTAAMLRRDYGLATPDAIHLASALVGRCEAILTTDADFLRLRSYPLPWAPERVFKVILAQELMT